jgi:hypothetical protein
MARIQALTAKEMTSKAHMQVQTNRESREKQPGQRSGPNWVETGPDRPAGKAHSGFGSVPPLIQLPFGLFIAPSPRATHELIRHLPTRSREERDTVPERRGSRWLTRVSLADMGTLHGRPRGVPGARIKIKVGSWW